MKKILWILILLLFLGGCGAKAVPEWTRASFNQLENFKKNYLRGNGRLAELNFHKAIEEIKRSGDLQVMGRAYLSRYAVQAASLETFSDSEYLMLSEIEQYAVNMNYFYFLKGDFPKVHIQELPVHYRGVFRASREGLQSDIDREVSLVADPLSRLIAAGLMVQRKQGSEAILNIAVQTASEQGWKKPLVAYLKRLRDHYEGRNEGKKSAGIRQRLELIEK